MPINVRGGFYYHDFRWRRKRYRITTKLPATAANEKFAKDWDAAIRREIALGTFRLENHFPELFKAAVATGTFKERAEAWLTSHKNEWGEWTYRKHRDRLRARIFPKIGARALAEIKPVDLRLLREEIIAEGKIAGGKLSNRTVNRIMTPAAAIFNELFADGEIDSNPAARLKKLKEKRIAEIDPFTDKEIERILKAARADFTWYYPYVRNLFEAGFRLEEHNGLKWARVNIEARTVGIREVMTLRRLRPPKTEHAIRDAEMTEAMAACYREQKSRSFIAGGFVWVTEAGKPIDISNFRAAIWVPLLKAARIERYRYPNQTRHTFATRHIQQSKDPTWIAKQMGTSLEQLFGTYTAEFSRARGSTNKGKGRTAARAGR